jgi:hypothetical protein
MVVGCSVAQSFGDGELTRVFEMLAEVAFTSKVQFSLDLVNS